MYPKARLDALTDGFSLGNSCLSKIGVRMAGEHVTRT
jgi:hypothetical protein